MSPRTKEQLLEIKEVKAARISEAALSLFATRGYEGTSISQIAEKAGISKGLIYSYFPSKEAILVSITDQVMDSIFDRFGFKDRTTITREDYEKFITLSLDIVLEDPDHWRLYFAIFTQPKVMSLILEDMMVKSTPYIMMMRDFYTREGYENPEIWMRFVSACIDGIQMHIMLDPENFPLEEVKKLVLKQFIK